MRRVIFVICAMLAGIVYAAEVTWVGGDATSPNDWDTAANWSPAAVPSEGDTVKIGADVLVEAKTTTVGLPAGIDLAKGAELRICNQTSQLTFNVPLTGQGTLVFRDITSASNAVQWGGDNRGFDGAFVSTNACVHVRDRWALGTTNTFTCYTYQGAASKTTLGFFYYADGIYSNDLHIVGVKFTSTQDYGFTSAACVTNAGPVTVKNYQPRFYSQGASYRFAVSGGVSYSGGNQPLWDPGSEVCGKPITYAQQVFMNGTSANPVWLSTTMNHASTFLRIAGSGQINFGCAHALRSSADGTLHDIKLSTGPTMASPAILNANGYDQMFRNYLYNTTSPNTDYLVLTSLSDPMTFTCCGTDVSANGVFKGALQGAASFTLDSTSDDGTWHFSRAGNTSTGNLRAQRGTIYISDNANFTALSKLIVAGDGTLDISVASGSIAATTDLVFDHVTNGVLNLSSGITLTVRTATIKTENGSEILSAGTYTVDALQEGDKLYGLLTGSGATLIVSQATASITECHWKGAEGADIAVASNWDPQPDDLNDSSALLIFDGGGNSAVLSGDIAVNGIQIAKNADFAIVPRAGTNPKISLGIGGFSQTRAAGATATIVTNMVGVKVSVPVADIGLSLANGTQLVVTNAWSGGNADNTITVTGPGGIDLKGDSPELLSKVSFNQTPVHVWETKGYAFGSATRAVTINKGSGSVPAGDLKFMDAVATNYVPIDIIAGQEWGINNNNYLMAYDHSYRQEMFGRFRFTAQQYGAVKALHLYLYGGLSVDDICLEPTFNIQYENGNSYSGSRCELVVRKTPVTLVNSTGTKVPLSCSGPGRVEIGVTGNIWRELCLDRVYFVCGCENAVSNAPVHFGNANYKWGTFDLGGYNQLIPQFDHSSAWTPEKGDANVVTVTSTTPATMTVTNGDDVILNVQFTGAAGLTCDGSGKVTLANFANTSTGTLTVGAQCEVALAWGATWAGPITIGEGGKLTLDADSATDAFAHCSLLTVAEGGTIDLPAGTTVQVYALTVNGARVPSGNYAVSDAALSGVFTGGANVIVMTDGDVGTITDYTWQGAAGAAFETADNWTPAGFNATQGNAVCHFTGAARSVLSSSVRVQGLVFESAEDVTIEKGNDAAEIRILEGGTLTARHPTAGATCMVTNRIETKICVSYAGLGTWSIATNALVSFEGEIYGGRSDNTLWFEGPGTAEFRAQSPNWETQLLLTNLVTRVYAQESGLGSSNRFVRIRKVAQNKTKAGSGNLNFMGDPITNNVPLAISFAFDEWGANSGYEKTHMLTEDGRYRLVQNGRMRIEGSMNSNFKLGNYTFTGGFELEKDEPSRYNFNVQKVIRKDGAMINTYSETWFLGDGLNGYATPSVARSVNFSGPGIVHFGNTNNVWRKDLFTTDRTQFILERDDVFPADLEYKLSNTVSDETSLGSLNLNGHAQTIGRFCAAFVTADYAIKNYYTLTSAVPATLTLSGSAYADVVPLKVRGAASVTFAGGANGSMALVRQVSDTTGLLTVASGTVSLDWGAAWQGGVMLEGGTFTVATDAAANALDPDRTVVNFAGGTLNLAKDVAIHHAYDANGKCLTPGKYAATADETQGIKALSAITGSGVLTVRKRDRYGFAVIIK